MTHQPEEGALTPQALAPITTIEDAIARHSLYLDVCRQLLSDDDYAVIRGQKWRKRSGWTQLRQAFNISLAVVEERRIDLEGDWGYSFLVQATHPSGRCEIADGACMASELADSNILPTLHNVRAKALTRAKNRASSDILGAGEVSAEELEEPRPKPTASPPKLATHWIDDPQVRKRFWAWCADPPALTQTQVHAALHVPHIQNFQGTTREAFQILQAIKSVITSDKPAERENHTHEETDEAKKPTPH